MSLVELVKVGKTYRQGGAWGARRSVRAVDNVSLSIEAGRCLALVGASGSGKSTLGRLVLGLEKPDVGSVLYKGRDFGLLRGEERRRARRNIQVVFQNSQGAVNSRFTAKSVIGEPLENFDGLRGSALTDRIAELLIMVGLEPKGMDKHPHQFSGGELQRICLARALAPNPELVVLDEAVSSLDMVNQSRILHLVERIGRETGTAFLFISHDLRAVCAVADAIAVMEAGRVVGYVPDINAEGWGEQAGAAFKSLAESVLPSAPSA